MPPRRRPCRCNRGRRGEVGEPAQPLTPAALGGQVDRQQDRRRGQREEPRRVLKPGQRQQTQARNRHQLTVTPTSGNRLWLRHIQPTETTTEVSSSDTVHSRRCASVSWDATLDATTFG